MSRPYWIGLTGNIACGKSTVLRELERLGAAVLDADAVVHQLMRSGTALHRAIVEAFGPAILASNGQIDRGALGRIVFRDAAALTRLEGIVHPAVLAHTAEWLEGVTAEVAVVDAIKLIEASIAERCDEVWVVTAPAEEQLRRLTQQRGHDREEALTRMCAQAPQSEKVARADVVIENSGSLAELRTRVRVAWAGLQQRRQAGGSEERVSSG